MVKLIKKVAILIIQIWLVLLAIIAIQVIDNGINTGI